MHNHDIFYREYTRWAEHAFFNDPEYATVKAKMSPAELARKMTNALACGSASKDGAIVKRTCKELKIPYTYKAIYAFLNTPDEAEEAALNGALSHARDS